MATSQNGWPIATRAQQDERPLIRNITVPNGVLAGDVATVFRWLAEQYDRRVESLVAGQCWGWYVKPIEGTSVASNHSSGCAVDFNAPQNPMGSGTTRRSLTARQIDECHTLERESDGVLRWGGDFSRNDPMHWEIDASRAAVAAYAKKIRDKQQEDDVLNADDKKWIAAQIRTEVTTALAGASERFTPLLSTDLAKNPVWQAKFTDPYDTSPTPRTITTGTIQRYAGSRGQLERIEKAVKDGVAALLAVADRIAKRVDPPAGS